MIERVMSKDKIETILELSQNIKVVEFDLKELSMYLSNYITSPAIFVLLDTDKKCFSVSSVWRDMVTPYVMVMYAWTDPNHKELSTRQLKMIKSWAKSMGFSVIRAIVRKNVKAWDKVHNFKLEGYLVKQEV